MLQSLVEHFASCRNLDASARIKFVDNKMAIEIEKLITDLFYKLDQYFFTSPDALNGDVQGIKKLTQKYIASHPVSGMTSNALYGSSHNMSPSVSLALANPIEENPNKSTINKVINALITDISPRTGASGDKVQMLQAIKAKSQHVNEQTFIKFLSLIKAVCNIKRNPIADFLFNLFFSCFGCKTPKSLGKFNSETQNLEQAKNLDNAEIHELNDVDAALEKIINRR